MKHIKITEKNLGSEKVLFDEDFSKLAIVTDVSVGVVGFDNLEDLFNVVDIIVTTYFLKHMKNDVSHKDMSYMKLIFMIHMLMSVDGDLIDEDVTKEFTDASEDLTNALTKIVVETSKDCSYMDAIDRETFKEYVDQMLVDELEEYEKRQKEE